jgi:hypothetical protein
MWLELLLFCGFATTVPLLTPLVATSAPFLTPLVTTGAPRLTPLHTMRPSCRSRGSRRRGRSLGLSIRGRQHFGW